MSRLEPPDREDLDQETKAYLDRFESEEMEWLPTSIQIMSYRPEIARAFVELRSAIFGGELDEELQIMMSFVSSHTRECMYCQAHTSCNLSLQSPETSNAKIQAAVNFEDSDEFTERERAALRLAKAASTVPNEVTDEHFENLREHFSDVEILELVATCALFGYLNCFNDTMATTLEETPLSFAEEVLSPVGWDVGDHQ